MRRFIVRVLVFSLLATALWWLTADWTRPATIGLAKLLHRIAGYPAPYLLADVKPYYWYSPLFPPLVGLMLASGWLSWRQRLGQLGVALACFWLMVALQIILVYSPYLPLSTFRSFCERMSISAGYIAAHVVLWLILTGGPLALLPGADRHPSGKNRHPLFPRSWLAPVAAGCFCLLFTVPIFVAGGRGAPGWPEARRQMAKGAYLGDEATALLGIQTILHTDPRNDGLIYMAARLHQNRGEIEDARRLAQVVFQRRHMTAYFDKEFGSAPARAQGTNTQRKPARSGVTNHPR